MYCTNCGNKLKGENFCPVCGTKTSTNVGQGTPQRSHRGGSKLRVFLVIAALVLVMVFVLGLLLILGSMGGDGTPADSNGKGTYGSLLGDTGNKQPTGFVADELDLSQYNMAPANGIQDIRFWMGGQFCRNGVTEMGDYRLYEYGSGALDGDVVEAYVEMLQQNGFTLVERYYDSFYTNSYLSYGLTCDFLPDATTHKQQFTDHQVHVSIYKTRNTDWSFYISSDLIYCDMGLRQNRDSVEIAPRGESAGAGLIRLGDGRYQTSDGRLTTAVGSAVVIRDGVENPANAFLELKNGRCILTISGYKPDEELTLDYKEGSLDTGDIFLINDVTDAEPSISMTLNGDKAILNRKHGSAYHSVTVRVMHYEESKDAVLYFYIESQNGDPAMLEVLCAFSTMPYVEPPETRPDKVDVTYSTNRGENYTMRVGDSILLDMSVESYHYGSDYHTYDWKIVSGGECIDIYGVGNHCYITAITSGTAVITLRYGYTEEGRNVLTGYPETKHRVTEYTFTITIEP